MKTVLLGFSVSAGTLVEIPVKHLAITGQTQDAGNTTALEALIGRSQFLAVTFITKRGVEASRGEKLKFGISRAA